MEKSDVVLRLRCLEIGLLVAACSADDTAHLLVLKQSATMLEKDIDCYFELKNTAPQRRHQLTMKFGLQRYVTARIQAMQVKLNAFYLYLYNKHLTNRFFAGRCSRDNQDIRENI
jgi:hypothetical protein